MYLSPGGKTVLVRKYKSSSIKMAPVTTTITEMEEVRPKPLEVYALNGSAKTVTPVTNCTKHFEDWTSLFHPKIGNGMRLKWMNIFLIFGIHFWALHSLFFIEYSIRLALWTGLFGFLAGFGVTGGVHRYWTHKTYKANIPMRIFLMICFSVAGQNTIFDWVRDHRVHHKFSDTNADPHNASRGFFFSHCGWLMQNKHPEVIRKGNQLDMSDVLADPVVKFSQRNFIVMKLLCCFIIPTVVPVFWWGENWYNSFMVQCLVRYVLTLNATWSVNSAAHIWGYKPYDKTIKPTQNKMVSIVTLGEGWHNYHHVFPWDYKAAELGDYSLNYTTFVLDTFAKIGWVWDRKQPSPDLVQRVLLKNAQKQVDHPTEVPEEEGKIVS